MPSTIILSDNGASSGSAGLKQTAGNDGVLILQTTTSGGTATNAIYVNTSQNVGLGVTPSAWGSGYKALDIQYLGISNTGAGTVDCSFTQNGYYNGTNWIAKYTSPSKRYSISDSGFIWYNGASATAGNAITFTQAMTLDASGNLAINDTSFSGSWNKAIRINGSNGSSASDGGLEIAGYRTGDGDVGAIAFYNAASSNVRLAQIYGERQGANNSGALTFHTTSAGTGSERARINSIGFFKASNGGSYISSSGNYHELVTNDTNTTAYFASTNATPAGINVSYRNADPNGTGNHFIYCEGNAATQRMSVRSNGGIANYSANNVNLSDRREKTNFAPAGDYLAKICAIPVQTFNYIDQNLEEDGGLTLGVVAQDVQAVAPELVMESNWAKSDEEPKMRLSIYQTDLQYALMKCIQELKAELDTAKAEIAALKGTQP